MKDRIQSIRDNIEYKKGQCAQIQKSIDTLSYTIKHDKRTLHQHEKALEIVKYVGLNMQKQLEYHLSTQVSLAMEAVFDDPYKLKVNFVEKEERPKWIYCLQNET